MTVKELKTIEGKEYTVLYGDFYTDGIPQPNMEKKVSISVTSAAPGKQKSQMKNLEETGIPYHKDGDKKIIIDCNLIINGSLTSNPL